MNEISAVEVLTAVLIAVALSAGSMLWYRRHVASSWSGTVVKFEIREVQGRREDNGYRPMPKKYYFITCRLDGGGRKKLKVDPFHVTFQSPGEVKEGDRLVKEAGKAGYVLTSGSVEK